MTSCPPLTLSAACRRIPAAKAARHLIERASPRLTPAVLTAAAAGPHPSRTPIRSRRHHHGPPRRRITHQPDPKVRPRPGRRQPPDRSVAHEGVTPPRCRQDRHRPATASDMAAWRHGGMAACSSRTAHRRRPSTGLAKGCTYLAVRNAEGEVRTHYLSAGQPHGEVRNRGRRPGYGPVRDTQRHFGQGVTAAVTPDSGRGPYEVESLISGRGGRNRTCGIRFWRPALWPSELHPFGTCSLPRAAKPDPQIFAVGRDGDRSSTTSSPEHPIRAAARSRRSEARAYARSRPAPTSTCGHGS